MKKRMSVMLILILVLSLGLVACGGGDNETQVPDGDGGAKGNSEEPKEVVEVNAEEPILLTSVGQSADVEMIKTMLTKNELDFTSNNLATSKDLGDAKTLILAVGGSSKGLGAAGIDANAELSRVEELISGADDEGLTIVAIHIGGEARRGELSDKFIKPSFEKADYAIVVKSGDQDGMMSDLANDEGIEIELIDSIADTIDSLNKLFE